MADATESIHDEQALRSLYGPASERSLRKQMAALDEHCRRFIALSPFLVMGTSAGDGSLDVSPKGDGPGFVAVLDDRRLLIPDRPGNNRLDGMRNLLENPQVGLLFLIPGVNETLRVNGRAGVTRDAALLAPLAVQGKQPRTGLLVEIEEVFLHCPKAFVRSRLWDPAVRIDRASLPSMGRMLADQIGAADRDEMARHVDEHASSGLY